MKTGYRTIARRRVEAARRIRRPITTTQGARASLQPLLEDPTELGSELVDLTSAELGHDKRVTGA